ncbi:MAG: ABC transporter permease [Flavobacteriales bacterium]|nr:ABC transporter permease [Flavobacteriales bacterium]
MFDSDRWNEIWNTLGRNKLRSFLTAFGVGWGIFMLIVMLGAGNGLSNGVNKAFAGWANNSAFIWTQTTSLPYQGFPRGRWFSFDNQDIEAIRNKVAGVDALAPRLQLGGWRGGDNVVYNGRTGAFSVNGDVTDIQRIQGTDVTAGRFLNEKDVRDNRKVAVVGNRVVEVLFEKDEDPLGKWIRIQGVYFQVVGVHRPKASANMGGDQGATIHVPFTTFQRAFNAMNRVHWFAVTAQPGTHASQVEADVKKLMAERHRVHPDDDLAFGSFNVAEMFDMTNNLFMAISGLGWFVGILTLLAGAIGVSNIMLVIVRERTKEIGIRRSIGASPRSITTQIVLESLTLTVIAGYLGLLSGMLILEAVNAAGIDSDFFARPEIDLNVALIALGVLIVSGLLAGLIPARRALAINAVDALRAE